VLYVTDRFKHDRQGRTRYFAAIWTVRLDGTGRRRVTSLLDAQISSAVWSPRGRRIAYAADTLTGPDGIYVMRARGGEARFIAEGAAPSWRATHRRG
jgi:Tol biopolymer transport system component